ncbi:membrane protein DedA with SNARE-associated domain [Isoptericola jiangsuensis]|uniref:Membrane protein DedA with SNARE-associated domain n=1 Tax=Isoptericola jiangsuensis TaxID=548579 RepID=A0A2A9ESL9_9MICO|nr:DedA family protein [Isoptericola jiangsuensis]PFG41531.1 membrane protein DedA with SNARE-associated domain [Isoptericola jiangsuensis]
MSLTRLLPAATHPQEGYDGFIGWVLSLMETLGEVGVGIAVLVENFVPPIPSEAVLPAAGFLAYEGRMSAWWAVVAATLGSVVGAWVWWYLGRLLGRDRTRGLVEAIPLMDGEDFDKAEAFFARWGRVAVLVGRCVPLVRSFVSIPAGIERMPFWSFTLYTTIGSGVWNAVWVGLGFAFGPAIKPVLEQWSGILSNAVVVVLALLVVWFVVVRLRRRRQERRTAPGPRD